MADRYYVRCTSKTTILNPFNFEIAVMKPVSEWLEENRIHDWSIVEHNNKYCFEFKKEQDANWFTLRWS